MQPTAISRHTHFIKQQARELGFQYCGISRAEYLEEEAQKLENWLNQKMHGAMGYMENHFDKRLDPRKLVPGAKSVVTLLYNYYPRQDIFRNKHYAISKYAYGKDYHFVIKDKLRDLFRLIQTEIGEVGGRVFVDSAPVLERAWAKRSGVGWIGKNSLLINKNSGSFYFLAELILDLELEPDGPVKDYCGTCTKCLHACPTGAITEPYVVDGSKCISYLTIELKDNIPDQFKGKYKNWIFGCDICQDVCPWNRFSQPATEPAFDPHPGLSAMEKKDWEEITRDVFNNLFRGSAVKRTKFDGLKRNISFLCQ